MKQPRLKQRSLVSRCCGSGMNGAPVKGCSGREWMGANGLEPTRVLPAKKNAMQIDVVPDCDETGNVGAFGNKLEAR